MTTVLQGVPAAVTAALSESSLDNSSRNTSAEVLSYNAMLDALDANDLDALASLIHDRAARQRVQIDYDEALALVESAWISSQAERSEFAPIIQVRVAVRRLVERGQYHPEQLDAFLEIARDRAPCERIARAAISEGVRDGLERRAAAHVN
jgi:hypothetical protein